MQLKFMLVSFDIDSFPAQSYYDSMIMTKMTKALEEAEKLSNSLKQRSDPPIYSFC